MDVKRLLWESKLAVALCLLIMARCVDRVLYTRITYDYTEFLWYFTNVILPIAFLVSSAPVVAYKIYFTDDITQEMREFPHYKYMLMALFDTLYNLLGAFPTPHIGGNMANVLSQLNLPFNMLLSYMFLQTRFKRGHILGSILVLYGGMVNLIPALTGQENANTRDPSVGWITLFIVSLVPAAASNVYKEIGLKDVDLDIWYANIWISFYQLIIGCATIWTVRIKAFSDPPVPWADFPSYVWKAHECFIGNEVELNGKDLPCDSGVLAVFLVFIVFNTMYNQLMLYIFKEGSSVLFVVSSAVGLPLTDLLYMIPLLTGKAASQAFTIYDGFSLFVLVMGLLVYHSEKEERKRGTESVEKSPMYASPSLQKTHLMRKRRGKVVYRQSPMIRRSGSGSDISQRLLARSANRNTYGSNANSTARQTSENGYYP
ncbi:hypothetical protein JG687_00000282 [Phytophthora cactorum]|uniref:Chloroquine-resistance transporter-like n=2 Tax=Phytophthora TaxID=4783 RepID=A0A329SPC8_9STRA|nr:hypothetical protein Pcac1_g330 [Phytophthora cactorum]KAG6977498.1 hypothetical protein JG688_00000301 [Phytophthora aleatoria]KAG2848825.1 hypothetical protein PC111_g237 [Phytophthora cactorum]KAG2849211.1 hypothetical protein PC112_g387 [Phytophthora cactorum]KAG2869031.1 hypothetical protein PC113_g472 [Phytophthora cactorum]